MTKPVAAVLLCAGQGTRYGGNKLVEPLADGTPMAVAAFRPLARVLDEVIAVVGDRRGELSALLQREGARVVENARSRGGVGTSIACGVAAGAQASGWVIALADMPWIPEPIIGAVAAALEGGADMVAPVYRGQRGHPVGFAARHGDALMRLEGDEGARRILRLNSETLTLLPVDDRSVVIDVDTRLDLVGGPSRQQVNKSG
jgi:molybdenum cofactor cytidylyltransferase